MYVRTPKAPKKSKHLISGKIEELRLLARANGAEDNHQIALWGIDHSEHWRSKGYAFIIAALKADKSAP